LVGSGPAGGTVVDFALAADPGVSLAQPLGPIKIIEHTVPVCPAAIFKMDFFRL